MKQCIKQWLTGILSLGLVFVTHSALASSCGSHGSIDKAAHAHQHKDKKAVTTDKTKKAPSFLFVIDAKQGEITKDKNGQFHLVLKHADMNHVIMFSDRPNRIVKYIKGERLQSMWKEGKDSFEKVPPNAVLSGTGIKTQIVILNGIHVTKDAVSLPISVRENETEFIGRLQTPTAIQSATLTIDVSWTMGMHGTSSVMSHDK